MAFSLLLLILPILVVRAEIIGWHPYLTPQLGDGLDSRQQWLSKPQVAILTDDTNYSGTGSASFSAQYSQHQLDLLHRFSLNVNASARYMMFDGKVHFSYVDDTSYTGNTINFAFECNRDYGFVRRKPIAMAPGFTNEINRLRQTLCGAALRNEITRQFGDSFISGYEEVGKVVVIYSFVFESESTARSIGGGLGVGYHGLLTEAEFETQVNDFFSRKDSQVSVSYKFYTSDPYAPILFPTNGMITTSNAFWTFAGQVKDYCNGMTRAGARKTAHIVEPLANLPGYRELVDGSTAPGFDDTSYDQFLDAYGKLKRWDETLWDWTIDNRKVSWMNTNGQNMVKTMRQEVSTYLSTLRAMARDHFTNGTPLQVPSNIIDYFANFAHIPFPSFGVMHARYEGSFSILYGYVLCGKTNLVREWPFTQCVELHEGKETGKTCVLRTMDEGEQVWSGDPNFIGDCVQSPLWSLLRDSDCRVLLFQWTSQNYNFYDASVAVKDDAGNIVDAAWMQSRNQPQCGNALAALPQVGLSIAPVSSSGTTMVDKLTTFEFAITNDGPGAAYGVVFSMPVPDGMRRLSVSGSHGHDTSSDGTVKFDVGPMASGSVTKVKVTLVPERTGSVGGGTPASITAGEGLTDPSLANNTSTLSPMTVLQPALSLAKGTAQGTNFIELSWISDTGLLLPQNSSGVTGSWSPQTNGIVSDGGRKTLRMPVTSPSQFFRLTTR